MKRKDEQEGENERFFVVGFDRERGRYLFHAHFTEIE